MDYSLEKGCGRSPVEDLVMAVIGDQFDECGSDSGEAPPSGGEKWWRRGGCHGGEGSARYPEICGVLRLV